MPGGLTPLHDLALTYSVGVVDEDAVTNLNHVKTRLLVQFWHLAERRGRVGPEGVSIPVPLAQEMLAKPVGATRPSVTAGLGRLASRGLLVRESDRG
ncbi:MAG: Crp/Fnr family transcriptional regulator [Thermoleophilaceae bacterium]|nr:Crp/Fnr family transcriptional regulator [Thermoleophilaceae bacterium]